MKNYPVSGRGVEIQNRYQMPCNRFSFAVLIGCDPDCLGFGSQFAQLTDNFLLILRYLVYGPETLFYFNSEIILCKVTYMPETGHNGKILTEEFFYRFCFCGRFNYYQIF